MALLSVIQAVKNSVLVAGLLLGCNSSGSAQLADRSQLLLEGQTNDSEAVRNTSFLHRLRDTVKAQFNTPLTPKPLGWKAVVIPVTLISYGTLSVASPWFDDADLLGQRLATSSKNRTTSIDDYTAFSGPVAVFGLNLAGVRGKNNAVDATMLYVLSYSVGRVLTRPTKKITERARPDSSNNFSFPSGHTSNAFIGAEFLRQEYKDVSPWIGAGGYALAILTGYLRMYNNKHWFSDVVAGAGVGILSTRISYWAYPKLKNAISGRSAAGTTMMIPTWQDRTIGICLVHRFK